jgi:hypothetical protein
MGGHVLLMTKYNKSPSLLLAAVYPDYEWLPWKFARVSKSFWVDNKNKKKFFDWAGKQLGIKQYDDWYKVNANTLIEMGGYFVKTYKLANILAEVYPEHNWEANRFSLVPQQTWKNVFQGKEMHIIQL